MTASVEAERNHALLEWYGVNQRSLPWREHDDPYATLVSEIMLQQTQAERVIPYFRRFMQTFPTVDDLAAASFSAVAALWSGLGYNRRAKRLHEAAIRIAAQGWPDTVADLEALPGVGRYTARAVAAFSFGVQVAAVDTNLRRVLSRWYGETLSGQTLDAVAGKALGASDAAAWNQAVMDLGATCCRPRRPTCDVCPVAGWCTGPDTYEPPRAQARFEGSFRQVRGAVVRHLVRRPATLHDLVVATGFDRLDLADAVEALEEDGLVMSTDDGYALAD